MAKATSAGSRLVVEGGRKLIGNVSASGSKYSAMLALAAALLLPDRAVLRNIPKIEDVEAMLSIAGYLGARIERSDTGALLLDASSMENRIVTPELTERLHSSYLFLPVLASRFDAASIGLPGGCRVDDTRYPVEIADLYARFGFDLSLDLEQRTITAVRKGCPDPIRHLDFSSISYRDITMFTKTAVLLTATAPGMTVIRRPFMGPELRDMCAMLRQMGVQIWGQGSETLFVAGAGSLRPVDHTILLDWTEALTLLAAGFISGGRVTVENLPLFWMGSELAVLAWMGAELQLMNEPDSRPFGTASVSCGRTDQLRAVSFSTGSYPCINTDSHPILAACLTQAPGRSTITEGVFSHRFLYVEQFRKMSARLEYNGSAIHVEGPSRLQGAMVSGHDIRTCASLLLLALATDGKTAIQDWQHLNRGYEDLPGKLRLLGGVISEAQA
ncbi:MAG: hypothetical protein RBS57_08320 [Desulforhabdus sp.]|jgi:UDP-N-acetylglucosamine 1-carboxyvinyltransferase|nr:hypothetical protein [Desulforhabdus sp.]